MSNYQQNRPFSSIPVIVAVAPGTVIHTFANLSDSIGGPPLEEITLWANNTDAAPQTLDIDVQGVTMSIPIPGQSTVQVFDKQVFKYGGALTSGTIVCTNATNGGDLLVWGYFTRT